MKTHTSDTFDYEQIFRVRLEINSFSRQFFDEELIYKESATKDAIKSIMTQFTNRISELIGLNFEVQAKLTIVSLPHGHQEFITEINDTNEFNALKSVFLLSAKQMIAR